MKSFLRKSLAVLLAVLSVLGLFGGISTVFAAEGYKAGDVIYVDYSAIPQWYTGVADTGFGKVTSVLYINFSASTRYDSGEKETVTIGDVTARFDPKTVTEKVDDCVYKYVVTEADAGKTTLRFWRGSETNLWNHSVELTYEDFSKGYNTVYVNDYNNGAEAVGSVGTSEYLPYDIEAELSILPVEEQENTYTVNVSCKTELPVEARYEYEIFINEETVGKTQTHTFTATNVYNAIKATVTATDTDGNLLAKCEVTGQIIIGGTVVNNVQENNLYAHAVVDGGQDNDAWTYAEKVSGKYYFFLPSSASASQVELYSTYSSPITIGDTVINPGEVKTINYTADTNYSVTGGANYTLSFKRSGAEAAVYVNNDGTVDGSLWSFLTADKENYTSCFAAIANADGTLDNTDVKKIKGRGNTTWMADKKPFNLNFKSAVTVGTMQTTKKYSLLANFQDAAMARNRVLYDLGDAVSLRYSCDSRFVDFYVDGRYMGQYQMCQKIEPGADNLVNEMEDDCHIDSNGNYVEEYPLLLEIPYGEDFWTSTNSGFDVVIKSPDVEGNDNLYANEVKQYVKTRFDAMVNAIKQDSENLSDYINIESFAKAYLIQELGKNWDTHSWYLVYVPDENGVYKFEASPVWDFDNSIGNANGVGTDLKKFGVDDYTLPTGWWGKYKTGSNNMTYLCTQNSQIMEAAKTVWFKNFVPALDVYASNGNTQKEILSADVYYNSLKDSAEMNYMKWSLLTNSGWVADHGKLTKATFDCETLTYTVDSTPTTYNQYTFKGQFDYMTDWLMSRAAWISNEWKDYYVPGEEVPDAPVTETKPEQVPSAEVTLPENTLTAFVFDSWGKTEEEKLTEYGDKSGYNATFGEGVLRASVNSDGYRALEWSIMEYGESGLEIVPLMTAGSKNPWGDNPYVEVQLSTKGFEDIAISLTSAGSKKCPASWQLAYSYDGVNFTDIDGAAYTISAENRKLPIVYFDGTPLPHAVADKDTVILRLYAKSNITVGGGTTADDPTGGELLINNIIITGSPVSSTVPSTSATEPTETTSPATTTQPSDPLDELILGDVDLSGKVNVKDATLIQKHIANLETFNEMQLKCSDANCDEAVNIKDATEIQKFVANLLSDSPIGKIIP
ncbi:MAG: CotH kinase family protein [Eubacteriales bacterium]|nr:CotH kinase family protein [Eubacteriales bacterium]